MSWDKSFENIKCFEYSTTYSKWSIQGRKMIINMNDWFTYTVENMAYGDTESNV